MEASLFSESWLRVAHLKLALKPNVSIHTHLYRGARWYVAQDHATGKSQRFSPDSYFLLGRLNGRSTVQEIWEETLLSLGDRAPTQEEFIQFISQLHNAELLLSDRVPDFGEITHRRRAQIWAKRRQMARSPLAIRLPLIDPDRFLTRWQSIGRYCFSRYGFAVWVVVVVGAMTLLGQHWEALTHNVTDRVFTPGNLLLLWFVYPVVKAFHELSHGFAVKRWGGEVHEMGVMFLVFFPVPYVDASYASAFRERYRRVVVGAAGMLAELFLAALALFVWVSVEPGVTSAVAYNVMLIGGVSTLVFNGNPLLRFDGYYIFADLVEIPNLGSRANRYIGYLVQRYVFRIRDAVSPVTAAGERGWFVAYAVGAFCYRVFIVLAIVMLVASQYFFVGVLLAIWALIGFFGLPILKFGWFLVNDNKLSHTRLRAIFVTSAVISLICLALFAVPAPHWTRVEGVVWLPDSSVVRAGEDGFVREILVSSGAQVDSGQPLVQMENQDLVTERDIASYRLEELKFQLASARFENVAQADILRKEIESVREEIQLLNEKLNQLVVLSSVAGNYFIPNQMDLLDAYFSKGAILGFTLDASTFTVRAAVPQDRVVLVRAGQPEVNIMVANHAGERYRGRIIREVPEGTTTLPSQALGFAGGGEIAIDPTSKSGMDTFQNFFLFDIEIESPEPVRHFGNRVFVRFEHEDEPLGMQLYRFVRQLFLTQFNV